MESAKTSDEAVQEATGRTDFSGVPLDGEPSVSETEKWRYWRVTLADGTKVSVNISQKNETKSRIAVQHEKLPDAEAVARWKGFWKDFIQGVATS